MVAGNWLLLVLEGSRGLGPVLEMGRRHWFGSLQTRETTRGLCPLSRQEGRRRLSHLMGRKSRHGLRHVLLQEEIRGFSPF